MERKSRETQPLVSLHSKGTTMKPENNVNPDADTEPPKATPPEAKKSGPPPLPREVFVEADVDVDDGTTVDLPFKVENDDALYVSDRDLDNIREKIG